MKKAIAKADATVEIIIGRDLRPVDSITDKFIPKPNSMTAYCKIFLDVNDMPGFNRSRFFINADTQAPMKMENTGPPIKGKNLPRYHDGRDIAKHKPKPAQIDLI
jgi:hypothetical protein